MVIILIIHELQVVLWCPPAAIRKNKANNSSEILVFETYLKLICFLAKFIKQN